MKVAMEPGSRSALYLDLANKAPPRKFHRGNVRCERIDGTGLF